MDPESNEQDEITPPPRTDWIAPGAPGAIRPGGFVFAVDQLERAPPAGKPAGLGGVAERFKAAVLKTVDLRIRGFESYSLRQFTIQHSPMQYESP